jgi:putative transposase
MIATLKTLTVFDMAQTIDNWPGTGLTGLAGCDAESFFSGLKQERIRKRICKTRDAARADGFEYIESFYNRTRRHSHLGGSISKAFEAVAA